MSSPVQNPGEDDIVRGSRNCSFIPNYVFETLINSEDTDDDTKRLAGQNIELTRNINDTDKVRFICLYFNLKKNLVEDVLKRPHAACKCAKYYK